MAKNIKKDVKILTCNACQKQHVISKELKGYSFECEGCGNEIFVDDNGNQFIIGTLKEPKAHTTVNKNGKQPDKTKTDKDGTEKNKFSLLPEED